MLFPIFRFLIMWSEDYIIKLYRTLPYSDAGRFAKIPRTPSIAGNHSVHQDLRKKMIEVCNRKIASKGDNVGLSFYAFFANKNDNPELLMEAATWWIKTQQFDHFEKAVKIRKAVESL